MDESCVIIGLGQIGMDYDFDLTDELAVYTHARAIALHPGFRLVGAVDTSCRQRTRFEQCYGAPAFYQVEAALRHLEPDVVVIATPTASHASILAKVCDNYRPKLVLCEKPLAYDLDEARGMVQRCEKAGIELLVNYMRRTDPGVVEIKRRLDRGEISTPIKATAWYSKGIMNNGSHLLNLLELWLGSINGIALINSGRLWNNHDPEPDAEVQFEQGTVMFRAAWEEAFSYHAIELISRSGRLYYGKGGEVIVWQGVRADPNFHGYFTLAEQIETIANGMGAYQLNVYEQICEHLAGARTTLCTSHQALKTNEAIDLIIRQR